MFYFPKFNFNKQSGFSLVEVLVGMFLILILFSLLIMEFGLLSISKNQKYENIAYHVANKQMEELRSTDFSSLPSSGVISDLLIDEIPSGSGSFTVNDYAEYEGLKEMVVTVNWNDGVAKSVVLRTLASGTGINPN
ncbi:MAG: prepilin-type N-terminal cleavage/methylation domain-containing protein [Candidatus Staskawiczbacteria bacterium]|nr:prepilin-type N-terminal cleavage/methylation domain-containing protein [Candidatus Staskawiczbacteria bacterium]